MSFTFYWKRKEKMSWAEITAKFTETRVFYNLFMVIATIIIGAWINYFITWVVEDYYDSLEVSSFIILGEYQVTNYEIGKGHNWKLERKIINGDNHKGYWNSELLCDLKWDGVFWETWITVGRETTYDKKGVPYSEWISKYGSDIEEKIIERFMWVPCIKLWEVSIYAYNRVYSDFVSSNVFYFTTWEIRNDNYKEPDSLIGSGVSLLIP